MIKTVKLITWIVVGLTIYSFVGGLVYGAHEHFYPGLMEPSSSGKPPFPTSEFVALLWPIGVPLWGAIELGSAVGGFANSALIEIIDE